MKNTSRGSSFFRNTLAQTAGRLLYLLTRVGLPPLILHFVSLEEYGLWATCFLLISYVSMGAFGVSNVYIRYVAEYTAKNEQESISGLISTGLLLTFLFSVVAMSGAWFAMPWILKGFKVSAHLQETAQILILGTLATMLLDMTLGAFAYVLHGLQKIAQQTVVWIISFLLETALIVGLLLLHYGVASLLWAFFARYIFSTLVYIALCYRAIPNLQLGARKVKREFFATFLKYGGVLQLSGLLSVAMYSIERVLAGYLSGLAAIAILDLGQKFPVMASQVFSSMNASFLPAITHAHHLKQYDEIQRLYTKGLRYLNLLNGLAMGFLAPFAMWLLAAWIGKNTNMNMDDTLKVMMCACAGYQLHVLTGPLSAYYQAINHPTRTFGYLGWQALFVITGLGVVWKYFTFDIVMIALLVMMARILSALIYLLVGNYRLKLKLSRFVRSVLLPGIMPYLFGYGLMEAVKPWLILLDLGRWQLIIALGVLGGVYVLLCAAFFYAYMCGPTEQSVIRQKILRRKA
jgi:O-antigen/teichoic acid export membrane protein